MQLRQLLIRLHLAQGQTYQTIARIIRACHQNQTVVTDLKRLCELGQLTAPQAQAFGRDWESAALERRYQLNAHLDSLTILDADYPIALLESYQPPLVLFLRGHRNLLTSTRQLAVVGTRQTDAYAEQCIRQLLPPLTTAQVVLVSGLAAGVERAAHTTAIACGLPTVAVLVTGLDRAYPPQHRGLQRRVGQVGLLISEYPLGTPARPAQFLARNRIIAGLCQTLLVVAARARSASLMTANLALQANRNVLAIPGPIDAELAVGCNQLIVAGAKPVLNSAHIIEEFLPII